LSDSRASIAICPAFVISARHDLAVCRRSQLAQGRRLRPLSDRVGRWTCDRHSTITCFALPAFGTCVLMKTRYGGKLVEQPSATQLCPLVWGAPPLFL